MNGFWCLWRKELGGYFYSPIAYATMTFFLAVMGFVFYFLTLILTAGTPGVGVINLMFGSPFYWMTLLVVIPLLTMRLFAEERRMGTLETLLTAPIADHTVVLAKFAGVLTFYIIMWLPTVAFFIALHRISADAPPLDIAVIASAYLGVWVSGALFLAIGLFCSVSTSNQIISAIYCFAILIILYFIGFLEYLTYEKAVVDIARIVSPHRHLTEFSRGVIDSRPLVLYISGVVFFLFTSTRMLESRQWK